MDIINKPLGWIIKICYDLTNNYALALIFFALIMQIILLPFGIKQQKNSVKQAALRPKEMAIRKKYAGRNDKATQQKVQTEIMELYQKENFNPMGGCLPLLIQMPILFALYGVVTQPLKYICGFGAETIKNIQIKVSELLDPADTLVKAFKEHTATHIQTISKMHELGLENFKGENGEIITAEILPDFTIFGGALDLSGIPSFQHFDLLLLIPLLTLIITYGSQWITKKFTYQPNQDAANTGSMKVMMWTMPLMSVYFTFVMPAAIGFYWIIRNILSTIQQIVLAKVIPIPRFTEEDYKAAEKEMNVKQKREKTGGGSGKKVRSLHRIDDEEDEAETLNTDGKPELKEGVDKNEAPKLKDESDRKKPDGE